MQLKSHVLPRAMLAQLPTEDARRERQGALMTLKKETLPPKKAVP